jgi:hypothetical protein
VRVQLVLEAEGASPEVEYTLRTLLDVAGLPHGAPPVAPAVPLHYGVPGEATQPGVVIGVDGGTWHDVEPRHRVLKGQPALYATQAPTALLHTEGPGIQIGFDLVQATFWLLSRQEELGERHRDAFDRYLCSESWLVRHELAETPLLNAYVDLLQDALLLAAARQNLPMVRRLRWPEGRPYAVVLSHDVDDAGRLDLQQGVRLLARGLGQRSPRAALRGLYFVTARLGWSLLRRKNPYWNFEAVMELEQEAGFRSSFYFVPEARSVSRDPLYEMDTQRMRELLAQLYRGGWEVGVHGSFDSYLDAATLAAQKQKLQGLLAAEVAGVRQHYLRLKIPDTFRAQAEAGFVYDSTLGYYAGLGFRAGAAFPFHPFDTARDEALPLLELPLTVMDGALFWHLKLPPERATDRVLSVLETVRSVGGLAVLLWHQRVRYEKKYPGWWWVYRQVVQHLCQENLAWVATAGQVADWWLAREAVRLVGTSADEEAWRWRYRADRAIAGLSLELGGARGGRVSVEGAPYAVQNLGEDRLQIDLGALATSQEFVVVLARPGGRL